MSSRVKSTTFEGYGDLNYYFINTFNKIFPLKIEDSYVRLANLVMDYEYLCDSLASSSAKVEYSSKQMYRPVALASEKVKINEDLHGYLAKSDTLSEEDYQTISRLALKGKEISYILTAAENRVKEATDTYFGMSQEANNLRRFILAKIEEIVEELKAIGQLDQNGKKRIDNLEIRESHFALIGSLMGNEEGRIVIKRFLESYFNLRVAAFKVIEGFALKIVNCYQNRQLLDGFSDKELSDKKLAIFALTSVNVNHINMNDCKNPLCMEKYNVASDIMDIMANYFVSKEFDMEKSLKLLASDFVDFELREVFMFMCNEIGREELQDEKPKR